jgi:hypothetical protein
VRNLRKKQCFAWHFEKVSCGLQSLPALDLHFLKGILLQA